MTRAARYLICRPTDLPHRARLFCFPHAGGGPSAFHSWRAALDPSVQICSVALPGRESRVREPLHSNFDDLAEDIGQDLQTQLELPFVVFGHSMGAMLAFEWVRRLQAEGRPMPACLIVSGRSAPHLQPYGSSLHALPDTKFTEELHRRYEGLPEELSRNPELLDFYLPILRADISIVESYRFREGDSLTCPIIAVAGIQDHSVTWEQLLGWGQHTQARFKAQLFPGGHFYAPEPLWKVVSSALSDLPL